MKYEILKLLKSKDGFISGDYISKVFDISRTAVWKNIKSLKREGYNIQSVTNKGYRLISYADALNIDEIIRGLDNRIIASSKDKIILFDEIDSTNTYAKKIANEGCQEGTVVLANYQSLGRGRFGRNWESAKGKGIYMSIIIKPNLFYDTFQLITLYTASSVVTAIKNLYGLETGIKWPNDVIYKGRKICGILTEASFVAEQINFVVVGIGVNVNHDIEDFQSALAGTAVSIKLAVMDNEDIDCMGNKTKYAIGRGSLVKEILKEFEKRYCMLNMGKHDDIMNESRLLSYTIGKEVIVTYVNGESICGIAKDIANNGKLIITLDNGKDIEVISGEVTIRENVIHQSN